MSHMDESWRGVIAEVLYQDVGVSNSKPIAFDKNIGVSPLQRDLRCYLQIAK